MTRRKPRQKRSEGTIDRILDATAELLEELGFDKLNTNLICERAGLTPPALYRYFPNKYSVLKQLGERLMRVQNEALYEALEESGPAPTVQQIADQLRGQYEVTIAQKGASWIMRALHATPQLVDVRRSSHEKMVERFIAIQMVQGQDQDRDKMERRSQIIVETGYAIVEMLVDNAVLDTEATIFDTATMISQLINETAAENRDS
ncbi:TetR/AcrR family transcriptional regulator [Sphingorhabdus sp. EL138]|uniref:TetR/AcrR family transcriptional regulator n=1 Tax=Sphingorhabdus sp. EL138 TaxID=2073156 RepID=UPI000D69BD69|nr:TetR/AcrR family transcriptional regulator [Sphingorhabdus sp. EL138]